MIKIRKTRKTKNGLKYEVGDVIKFNGNTTFLGSYEIIRIELNNLVLGETLYWIKIKGSEHFFRESYPFIELVSRKQI
jgi:hypothetical protein